MRFEQVYKQAKRNTKFAREIASAVQAARRDGLGSAAWERLATFFAENDQELRLLTPPASQKFPDTTVTLMTNSEPTGGTTTTQTMTTTSRLCSLPGICPTAKGRRKTPAKKARK